jgi:MFS family permease
MAKQAPVSAAVRPVRRRGRFSVLVMALFAVSLSANIVTPLLPLMLKALAFSPDDQERQAAFLNGVYLLAMFSSAPLPGYLSDRSPQGCRQRTAIFHAVRQGVSRSRICAAVFTKQSARR